MTATPADWDTSTDEALFLGSALVWLDSIGLRDHDALIRLLSSGVDDSWFLDRNHQVIYQALLTSALDLSKPGVTVRLAAVIAEAERLSGESGWVRPLISSVCQSVPTLDLDHLTATVIPRWWQKLKRRAVRDVIGEIDRDFLLPPTPDRFAAIDRRLGEALDRWRAEPDLQATGIGPFDKFLADLQTPRPQESFVSTGLADLDDALGGGLSGPGSSAPGKVIVVCARPGAGKTMLVGTLALHVARAGHPVCVFSLEMGEEQLVARITAARHLIESTWRPGSPFLASEHVSYKNLITREFTHLSQPSYDRLFDGGHAVIQDNLAILTKSLKPQALAQRMRLQKQRYPNTRLFVIDHLGLLDLQGENRAVAVGEATRQIKTTAVELGVDVLLVAQLNRSVENRENKMPGLSDLRDSGRVEEDADVVLGLHRPAYYNPQADPSQLQIGVLKNRQGRVGQFDACVKLDCCAVLDAVPS
jgi:replicative DNA helicase